MKISISILLVFLNLACLLGQDVNTSGGNSAAVIARNFSATYGVRADAVEAILWIYEAEGYDEERRKRATEQILREYAQSPEKKEKADELSAATRQKMGITDAPQITNALEWDLFARSHYLSTTGYNSPAVVAKGDVNIWYGIPPKALRALAAQLEKNKTYLEEKQADFETQLAEQVKKYEELKTELETYGSQEEIYRQAEALLEEGQLEEAEQLIESDFETSLKRQAYKGYIYGKTKELLLKYDEATKGYKNAVNNDERNSTYHLYYAYNENTLARHDEAIRHYEIALGIDTLSSRNDERIATLFNNLGLAWDSKGEYDKAIGYYEKALQIDLNAFGDKHPKVAIRYNNLGEAWRAKGDYDKAIGYYEKCQAIWNHFFEPTHPYQKTTAQNLSSAANSRGMELFSEKKYQEALGYFQKALQNAERAQDDVFSLTCFNNIGSMQKHLEKYEEGLQSLDVGLQKAAQLNEALDKEIKEQLTPEMLDNPEVQNKIAALKNLALIRRMQYHKAGCLKGLKREKEADALAGQLWQEGIEANDTRLLEDLKKDGYDFGR